VVSGIGVWGGVYVSPIVLACVVALLATAGLSMLLTRVGFYRLVWHRPLVEVAIFCLLLTAAGLVPKLGWTP
jgi:protein AaeX